MDVRLLCLLRWWRPLRLTDHSSRGVLTGVYVCACVIYKAEQ